MLSTEERDRLTDIQDRWLALYVERQEAEDDRDAARLRSLKPEIDEAQAEHAELRQNV